MDILVKLTVPGFIYRFYQQASAHIADSTAEDIMADALSAYAVLLSEDVAKELGSAWNEDPGNSSVSRSR